MKRKGKRKTQLTSHSCPANSGGHWHTKLSNTAWHRPPFWQGPLAHLFLWISQCVPTKPSGHRQWEPRGPSCGENTATRRVSDGTGYGDRLRRQDWIGGIRTLHVAPFLHWPWQRLRSGEDKIGVSFRRLFFLDTRREKFRSDSIHGEVQSTRRGGLCSD